MSRLKCCAAFASLLAVACAAKPTDVSTTARLDPPAAETEGAEVARTIELDSNELDTSAVITCRDTRQLGTNVLVTRCMTQEGWARYKRIQEIQAQQFLRTLRGER